MLEFEKFLDCLEIKDLPGEEMRYIAENCGISTVMFLLKNFEGSAVDVPQRLMNQLKIEFMRRNWNGSTFQIKKFAAELHISEKTIRRHLGYRVDEPGTEQMNLFQEVEEAQDEL